MSRTLIQLTIAGVLLVASCAGYAVAHAVVAKAGARVVAASEQIKQKNEEAKEIRKARTELTALSESEARVTGYFVSQDAVVPFLEEIGSMGKAFGSTVEVVSVTEDITETGRTMLDLSLQISGSFSSVMRTVGNLEYGPYDIALTNLSLDATSAKDNIWTASATYQVGTILP